MRKAYLGAEVAELTLNKNKDIFFESFVLMILAYLFLLIRDQLLDFFQCIGQVLCVLIKTSYL